MLYSFALYSLTLYSVTLYALTLYSITLYYLTLYSLTLCSLTLYSLTLYSLTLYFAFFFPYFSRLGKYLNQIPYFSKSHRNPEYDINYKPSMKNIQSFHVIRFFTKIKFVPKGHFSPHVGLCFIHLQLKQSTDNISLKLIRI